MKFFDQVEGFPYIRWIEGFCMGIIAVILLSLTAVPPKPKIIVVPEVKVIEKPVIVKKPVYVSANDRQQIQCLAENAYFEAGNQSKKGKIAVSNVVMNRTKDGRFGSTPCQVVHQKSRGVCQFSWVCEGKKRIHDMVLFAESKRVAEDVYLGNVHDVTKGAKFYHANYVHPGWNLRQVAYIGAHIFYKDKEA